MDDLLQAIIAYFEDWLDVSDSGNGDLQGMVAELKGLGAAQAVESKTAAVVDQWLLTAVAGESPPHGEPLLAAIKGSYQTLPWAAPPPSYIGDAFHKKSAYVQLVGPKIHDDRTIPFTSDNVAVGLMLLAPELLYPPHYHKAAEYYGILTGLAEWQIYYNPPVFHPPGAHIFHPSEAPHAMQTHDEPLLLVWAWTGEIEAPVNMGVKGWL